MKSKRKEDRLKFSKLKNEITNLTRKSKEEYYKKYFEKNNKNSKKIWNGIKEIINIKQKSSSLPTSLKDKDKILTNQKEIAEHFNCYFWHCRKHIREEEVRRKSLLPRIFETPPTEFAHVF